MNFIFLSKKMLKVDTSTVASALPQEATAQVFLSTKIML
mgnify:CR=1 FL=1